MGRLFLTEDRLAALGCFTMVVLVLWFLWVVACVHAESAARTRQTPQGVTRLLEEVGREIR